jgi:hypothetical protein
MLWRIEMMNRWTEMRTEKAFLIRFRWNEGLLDVGLRSSQITCDKGLECVRP